MGTAAVNPTPHQRRLVGGVVREYVGHGVGRQMHEEPQVPNFGPEEPNRDLTSGGEQVSAAAHYAFYSFDTACHPPVDSI